MRKLIIGAIVLIVMMGAWVLYLEYDTKRFIQSLPKAPTPPQDLDAPPANGNPTPHETQEPEKPVADVLEDTQETFEKPHTGTPAPPATPLFFESETVEPEPDDKGLSPELEALFLGIHLLEEERMAVYAILDPMSTEDTSIMFRQQAISRELSQDPPSATKKALYEEREALLRRQKELSPRIFELQDEYDEILAEQAAFLEQSGIVSWQEFKDIYGDAYKTWRADP